MKKYFIDDNTNIFADDSLHVDGLLEKKYWMEILSNLKEELPCDIYNKIKFSMVFGREKINIEKNDNKTNVIIVADEHQSVRPELYVDDNIIFQSSYSSEIFKGWYDKLYEFPIGYNTEMKFGNEISFANRDINVFFSGNLHRGRKKMFEYYSWLGFFPFFIQHRLQSKLNLKYDNKYENSYIRFTNGFMKGLSINDYVTYMKNSRIVLTPHGSIAEECFRHYEALKSGCVVISERLPDNYFFTNSPIIQIDNWRDGDKIIKDLISSYDKMYDLHLKGLKWWDDVMSEKAVAKYMAKIILNNTN